MATIKGNKKLGNSELVTWFDAEHDVDRPYTLNPLTRTIKRELVALREKAQEILTAACERQGLEADAERIPLNGDEDEALTRNALEQITLLTEPRAEDAEQLGELIGRQWENDLVVDADISALAARLAAAAGKPSAS